MAENDQHAFAVLGLEPAFEIDPAAVERAAMTKLAAAHPDVVGDSGADDSATVNDARATLLDDEKRLNLYLRILGGPSSDEDRSLPENFLTEMMGLRSKVEEDFEQDKEDARKRWTAEAERRREELKDEMRPLFDKAPDDEDARQQIRERLNQWRYFERLIEQLDDAPS